jgi:hypothetical protein
MSFMYRFVIHGLLNHTSKNFSKHTSTYILRPLVSLECKHLRGLRQSELLGCRPHDKVHTCIEFAFDFMECHLCTGL